VEADFWAACKDLAAKTLVALQPSLAMQYRCHFPRKRRRAGQVKSETIHGGGGMSGETPPLSAATGSNFSLEGRFAAK
jgi:hypothetical protein